MKKWVMCPLFVQKRRPVTIFYTKVVAAFSSKMTVGNPFLRRPLGSHPHKGSLSIWWAPSSRFLSIPRGMGTQCYLSVPPAPIFHYPTPTPVEVEDLLCDQQ